LKTNKDSIHICFVASSFYPAIIYGGPILSNYNLCKVVNSDTCTIQILTTNANGKVRLDVNTEKNLSLSKYLYIRYFNETIIGRFSKSFLWQAGQYFKSCDLIHCSDIFSTTYLISVFHSIRFKKNILISTRGTLANYGLKNRFFVKKIWIRLFVKPIVKNLHFLATSEKEKVEITRHVNTENVHIIPNGIDIKKLHLIKFSEENFNAFLKKYKIHKSPKQKLIVSLGRMDKKKGFDILISAYNLLKTDNILIIAGPYGPERESLTRQINNSKSENIFLLENLEFEEKNLLLKYANVFALPSHDENFGNVYLEALILGTPIVASTSTPWEHINAAHCGIHTENTSESFAQAIKTILENPHVYTSENCIHLAEQYSLENYASNFKQLYQKIIDDA